MPWQHPATKANCFQMEIRGFRDRMQIFFLKKYFRQSTSPPFMITIIFIDLELADLDRLNILP